MRYLHTLDPDQLREMSFFPEVDDYFESVAELEAEDKAMEKYYEQKHN